MRKFDGTIEFLSGRNAAIVELTCCGEWAGGGLIELKSNSRNALYEEGYTHLARAAQFKGGRLETYRVLS